MINWTKTIALGTKDLNGYRPRVAVQCDKCNKESIITIRVKSRIIDNQLNWECPSCVGLRPENSSRSSSAMLDKWQEQEYVNARKEKSESLWNNSDYQIRHASGVNKPESRQKCSEAARLAWEDDEYRKIHSEALIRESRIKPQTEVKYDEILKSLGIEFSPTIIGPYTFDYLIKRPGRKSLLIEINGNYWHTRPYVMRKDKAKASYIANLPEFELRTIWEHQLADIERIIYLTKSWLGLLPDRREISLTNVTYKLCNSEEVRDFISNYHYLGSMGRAGIQIGAYFDNMLIGAAVLAHPTRKEIYTSINLAKHQVLELTRFVLSPHIHNNNLASHFLSKLPKFTKVTRLISFSDPAAGHSGTIYKAANWVYDGETTVSYFYVKANGWKMHKKTLYNQAKSMHMSENEFAERFGYNKIHTPPLMKFHYDL